MGFQKACVMLCVVGLLAGSAAADGRALQQLNVVSAAGGVLSGAFNAVEGGLTNLVSGLFGPQNSFLTNIPSNIAGLSWGSLQNLDIQTPVNNFMSAFNNLQLPTDIFDAENKITGFFDKFCIPSICQPTVKIPSNCYGKQLIVRLAPWKCELYKNATVGCTPPFIEILKSPAGCAAKYSKAGFFKGQECKLEKLIGKPILKTIGGQAFSVSIDKNLLNIPSTIAASLLPGAMNAVNGIGAAATSTLGAAASGLSSVASSAVGTAASAASAVAAFAG